MHVWTREHAYKNYIKLIREYKQKGTCWVIAMVIETRSMLEVNSPLTEWTRWIWHNARIHLYSRCRKTIFFSNVVLTNCKLTHLAAFFTFNTENAEFQSYWTMLTSLWRHGLRNKWNMVSFTVARFVTVTWWWQPSFFFN